jgi:tRNA(Ile)-lysidine synthase
MISETAPALEAKAREAIARFKMLDGRKAVLVGVSGGADSMALLSFLCSLRQEKEITVLAAHINHGLRGGEADRDEQFVRDWCETNKVKLFVLHADVKARAERTGETIEEAGRNVRYSFFAEKSTQLDAAIATAHTLSDSIETQLINFARGTGLRGLCGIPPVRGDIIRPLIRCTRSDTEEYCHYNGIKYVNDSTNFSHDYTRNSIRLDVVPKLYKINPAFDKAAARLISILEDDESCLAECAKQRLALARRGKNEYDITSLADGCPVAILSRCVSIAAADFAGMAQEEKHIAAIVNMIRKGAGKIEIRGGGFAKAEHGKLIFTKLSEQLISKQDFIFPFMVGMYENSAYKLAISTISEATLKNFKKFNNQYFKNAVDCDKIRDNALIRAKMQGDKISPVGRNVTKTLKKLFNEAKIPPEDRAFIPVAADGDGAFWAGEIGVSERCKVTDGTKNAILLEIKRLEV